MNIQPCLARLCEFYGALWSFARHALHLQFFAKVIALNVVAVLRAAVLVDYCSYYGQVRRSALAYICTVKLL
jgi:hypothetical protein